jgi:GNAT superfamily N-acetyltransferase
MPTLPSRDLPITRSDRFVSPFTVAHDHGDHVVYDSPNHRGTWYGHRLVLDRPPDDLTPWFDRWRALHGHKGVTRAYVCWETDTPDAPYPALLSGQELERSVGLLLDGDVAPVEAALPLVEVDRARWPSLVATACSFDDRTSMEGYITWFYEGLRALGSRRRTWAAVREGELVAALSLVDGEGCARLQDVWTVPAWRRRGLCSALLGRAIGEGRRAGQRGPVITAASRGGAAERLYQGLGFRAASWGWDASVEVG